MARLELLRELLISVHDALQPHLFDAVLLNRRIPLERLCVLSQITVTGSQTLEALEANDRLVRHRA